MIGMDYFQPLLPILRILTIDYFALSIETQFKLSYVKRSCITGEH